MKSRKEPFCFNELCEFNQYDVKITETHLQMLEERHSSSSTFTVDRYPWKNQVGERVMLCDCCTSAVQMISKAI